MLETLTIQEGRAVLVEQGDWDLRDVTERKAVAALVRFTVGI